MYFRTAAIAVCLTLIRLQTGGAASAPPTPYPAVFTPGTPAEQPLILKSAGTSLSDGVRHANVGQFWTYGFATASGARCRLEMTLEDAAAPPNVQVLGPDAKPLPIAIERGANDLYAVLWTVPPKWPIGARIAVMLSAKTAPFGVRQVRFQQTAPSTLESGLPDSVVQLMRQNQPTTAQLDILRPGMPYTTTQTGQHADPALDLQTDALFAYTSEASAISGWKARGYTVWTMGGARAGKEYAALHPDEVQTTADGKPISVEGSYYLSPTLNRIAEERRYYDTALTNGSEGICPEEPEYWARAGYEGAFRQAWQRVYRSPWQDPAHSVEARWQAGQLMAQLETEHIDSLLQNAVTQNGRARRMVALHSPINYAQWGIVSPQYRISRLPWVQDVIGQVWTGTARSPIRYAGVRQDRTFSLAYLEYSSLTHLLRGTGKRLWFLMDPLEDTPGLSASDYKSHYEQILVAALLFPDVTAYEVMPWPERVYGHTPADYAVEINSVIAALEEMHTQTGETGNAATGDDIGVFVSDSMQWQREAPNASDFDGLFGLTLPLLQRGVPVQAVSLDRAAEPNYLKPFKTLLLSYDFQKPPDARVQAALADWVRHGGSLIFFGGSDAYNAVSASWWRQAKLDAPQTDLWSQLGLPLHNPAKTVTAEQEDIHAYQLLLQGDGAEHDLKNRRAYTLDLTKFAQQTGSVAVRFADVTPQDGWGAFVASVEMRIGGRLAASFAAGSEIENRFLVYDRGSQFNGAGRFADRDSSWTYRFDNLPPKTPITLTVDMGNGFAVSAAPAAPNFGHTLIGVGEANVLAKEFPRLRIDAAYSATVYPDVAAPLPVNGVQKAAAPAPAVTAGASNGGESSGPMALYMLRAGGALVWMANVGHGLVINVGVAPGFFSASERSAGLLRALTQYASQRAGGTYSEPGSLRLRRGRYTIVRTFEAAEPVGGRTIDLLSPTLAVAEGRTVPRRSLALLCDLDQEEGMPHVAFVSGRLQAKIETAHATVFFARGPLNTTGAARLATGGRRLTGARATDWLGRPVTMETYVEEDTVLLRYPNSPDGVLVHAGWQ